MRGHGLLHFEAALHREEDVLLPLCPLPCLSCPSLSCPVLPCAVGTAALPFCRCFRLLCPVSFALCPSPFTLPFLEEALHREG